MTEIMRKCDHCVLGIADEGVPYLLPLNFGMEEKDGEVILYFHGATEGRKYALLENEPQVAFEMDCAHKLILEDTGACTMNYESVIGKGKIFMIEEFDEKMHALEVLMGQYHGMGKVGVNQAVAEKTKVFGLKVEEMTGKIREKKQG